LFLKLLLILKPTVVDGVNPPATNLPLESGLYGAFQAGHERSASPQPRAAY